MVFLVKGVRSALIIRQCLLQIQQQKCPQRALSASSLICSSSRIGQTTVMYQSGLRISELPLVVKKVQDVLKILPAADEDTSLKMQHDFLQALGDRDNNEETREIIAGLRRCFTVNGIFKLLETIPAEEVTPSVAVEALKLILTLDVAPPTGQQQQGSTDLLICQSI